MKKLYQIFRSFNFSPWILPAQARKRASAQARKRASAQARAVAVAGAKTSIAEDFILFKQIINLMNHKEHLTLEGLTKYRHLNVL